MAFPGVTFGADTVAATEFRRSFCTAILAQPAIGAYLHAVLAFFALRAELGTVGAVFTAVNADVIGTVAAVIAVAAHAVGTVNADAAVGTEFINTSGAFAALLAHALGTVGTDGAAVIAYFRAFAALITILAEDILRTFTANIAGHTEFVRAVGAFFAAVRTEIRTVFASLAARADNAAVRAESAVYAEAVRTRTVNALAAFRAHLTVGAVRAFFVTIRAYGGTVGAALSAGAHRLHAFMAE